MANRFWVNNGGSWSDGANHWSLSSGGSPGATVPGVNDSAIIDFNSLSASGETISLDQDVNVQRCDFYSDKSFIFTTNNYTITVTTNGGTLTAGFGWEYTNGSVFNAGFSTINVNGTRFILFAKDVSQNMTFNGRNSIVNVSSGGTFMLNGSWLGGGGVISGELGELNFLSGTISLSWLIKNLNHTLVIDTLNVSPGVTMTLSTSGDVTTVGTVLIGQLNAIGTESNGITFNITGGSNGKLSADSTSLAFVSAYAITASGTASPFDDTFGGINLGFCVNWLFPSDVSPSSVMIL